MRASTPSSDSKASSFPSSFDGLAGCFSWIILIRGRSLLEHGDNILKVCWKLNVDRLYVQFHCGNFLVHLAQRQTKCCTGPVLVLSKEIPNFLQHYYCKPKHSASPCLGTRPMADSKSYKVTKLGSTHVWRWKLETTWGSKSTSVNHVPCGIQRTQQWIIAMWFLQDENLFKQQVAILSTYLQRNASKVWWQNGNSTLVS